jgi:hypothetical protein
MSESTRALVNRHHPVMASDVEVSARRCSLRGSGFEPADSYGTAASVYGRQAAGVSGNIAERCAGIYF